MSRKQEILIGLVGAVFANDLRDQCSISGWVIPKTLKIVLDTYLLNTQHYKVCIKGKVTQSRERSSTLPYTSGCSQQRLPTLLYFFYSISIIDLFCLFKLLGSNSNGVWLLFFFFQNTISKFLVF